MNTRLKVKDLLFDPQVPFWRSPAKPVYAKPLPSIPSAKRLSMLKLKHRWWHSVMYWILLPAFTCQMMYGVYMLEDYFYLLQKIPGDGHASLSNSTGKFYYHDGVLIGGEWDRNSDGITDSMLFMKDGAVFAQLSDKNYDGVFEKLVIYHWAEDVGDSRFSYYWNNPTDG